MFGTYRYLLAFGVVAHHSTLGGLLGGVGHDAVFCFYALSGYLMTAVLQERYGYTPAGLARYGANRALRIYPPYWLALALALGVIASIGSPGGPVRWPVSSDDRARSIGLIGLTAWQPIRVISPAWSLQVELCFYAAMGLGLSRGPRITAAWWCASAAWVVVLLVRHVEPGVRFASLGGSSIAFASGALVYHYGTARSRAPARPVVMASGVALAGWFVASRHWMDPSLGLYVALALGVVLQWGLASAALPAPVRRLDDWLGAVSYSVFLLHTPILVVIDAWIGTKSGAVPALLAAALSTAGAVLVRRVVEEPIERVRRRLRRR